MERVSGETLNEFMKILGRRFADVPDYKSIFLRKEDYMKEVVLNYLNLLLKLPMKKRAGRHCGFGCSA